MRIWLVSACVTLGLVACGGGDDKLSKADFIESGDKLCLDFNTKAKDLATPPPESAPQLVTLLDKTLALADETRADLEALKAPEDGEAVKKALVESLRLSTNRVRDARDAADRGDGEGFESAMAEADQIGKRADEEAKAYGFEVCGSEDELPDT